MWSSNGPTASTSFERGQAQRRLSWGALLSLASSAAVMASAWGSATRLGAPSYWPWLLTGLQVLALWSAGSNRWWGWLLGASVQPPWIAYALVTGQFGFIPGCAISAAVQAHSFARWNGLVSGTAGPLPRINPTTDPFKEVAPVSGGSPRQGFHHRDDERLAHSEHLRSGAAVIEGPACIAVNDLEGRVNGPATRTA